MADFNRKLTDLQGRSQEIQKNLMYLLRDYENVFREVNGLFVSERLAGAKDLNDFYRLVQIVRRNRDVLGSLVKGFSNFRPTEQFRFVEDEISEAKGSNRKKSSHSNLEQFSETPTTLAEIESHEEKSEVLNG